MPTIGVIGYPEDGGNLRLDNLGAGGGIYIYSDGTSIIWSASGPYLTYDSAPEIVDSRHLKAGNNVIFDRSVPGELTIVAQATGGTGADTSLSFVTMQTEPSLTNERRLNNGLGITLTDNGPNSTVDIGLSSSLTNATFLTVGSETLLTGERRLAVQGDLALYDNGANSTMVVTASQLQDTASLSTAGFVDLDRNSTKIQLADCTSNNIVYNLPAAASAAPKVYIFKKIDPSANTVTLEANGLETIDGQLTCTIPIQWMSLSICAQGSSWYIV